MDGVMYKKGSNTRRLILSKAKALFSQRGYTAVTMKDVCEACALSRGGLYRYFGSTKEIFIEILNADKEDKATLLSEEMKGNKSALQMLRWFLSDRKRTLMLGEDKGFSFIVQEFVRQEPDQCEFIIRRYEQAKQALRVLFEYGQSSKEFLPFDTQAMATTFLLHLDSLEINSASLSLTEAEIDAQLDFLLRLVC